MTSTVWPPHLSRSSHSPAQSMAGIRSQTWSGRQIRSFLIHWRFIRTNLCHKLAARSQYSTGACRSTLNLQACCRAELRKEHISSGSDPIQFVHWKDLFFSNESFTNDTTLQSWSWKLICNNKEANSNTTHLFLSGKSGEKGMKANGSPP